MIGTAWAADAAEGHGGSIFSDPAFWVGVAFVLFFALAGKALWKRVSDILDKRASAIAKALADAERLRDEALKAKQDAERTLAQATTEGGAIIQQARNEAQRMQARAEASLKTAVALREQQAGAVQRIGRLVEGSNLLMQPHLTRNHGGANHTLGCVSIHGRTYCGLQFVASVEDGERLDIFAARGLRVVGMLVHNNPSSCARNFRVARNNEFLTVSSEVPRASPMARNFRP